MKNKKGVLFITCYMLQNYYLLVGLFYFILLCLFFVVFWFKAQQPSS